MYMLDTNALIILLYGNVADGKLTDAASALLKTEEKLYLSVASLSENGAIPHVGMEPHGVVCACCRM